jgi:hypothetical protein
MSKLLDALEKKRMSDFGRSLKQDMGQKPQWSFFELVAGEGRRHEGQVFANQLCEFVVYPKLWTLNLLDSEGFIVASIGSKTAPMTVEVPENNTIRVVVDACFMEVPYDGWEIANVDEPED